MDFNMVTASIITGNTTDSETCMEQQTGNKTVIVYEGYGGVPENLTINALVWVILLIVFAVLRRYAWDYGRIALVSRREENVQISPDGRRQNKYNVWTSLFYGEQEADRHHGSLESLDTQLHTQDKGLCSWLVAFIKVKDSDIVKKCGQDALQYITFQRYLLLYLTIVCVLSTAIIVPVNFTGNNVGNATDFGHTTIANLDPRSGLLWIHSILSLVYMVLAVIFMRHFSVNLKFEDDEQVSKTLMISNIPKDKCFKNLMMQHFQIVADTLIYGTPQANRVDPDETAPKGAVSPGSTLFANTSNHATMREGYPEIHVEDIQFAYNVESLMELDTKRANALEARLNSEMELQKTGKRPTIRPYPCGQCLCCGESCGCVEVDAISYYEEEEKKFKLQCEQEKACAYQAPLGVAFVTFESVAMAERIQMDFQPSCKAAQNPQPSSVHTELDVVEWVVKYAPAPQNIYWAKLALAGWKWWFKAILINTGLCILLFFLTTPSIVLNNLDKLNYKDYFAKTTHDIGFSDYWSALLVHFLPTLLLWTFTALLPNIVYYSDQYVGHWTRSSEHYSVMQKTFIFLLLMVLILPSLGLTSAKALFDFFILDHQKNVRWNCIFLSGNGAFFVNYVITSAFIGTALELLRFSELFMYALKLLLARSSAERTSVRKHVLWEFQYGMQYAWVLCVFATIMSYSISCPLIAPFGLVYMILKHIVDRYNLYFAYKPSHISPSIHWTAINYVIIAVVFLQFNFVFFSVIRAGSQTPLSIFSIVILFFTLMIFFGRVCFGCCKNIGPLATSQKYKLFDSSSGEYSSEENAEGQRFVANVLSEDQNRSESRPDAKTGLSATDTLAQSYGSIAQQPGAGPGVPSSSATSAGTRAGDQYQVAPGAAGSGSTGNQQATRRGSKGYQQDENEYQ